MNKIINKIKHFFTSIEEKREDLQWFFSVQEALSLNLELCGRNKLMEKLRKDKILMKETKEVHYENGRKIINVKNIPYSHFVQAGCFVTKTSRREKGNTTIISTKTIVTTKGINFLIMKYNYKIQLTLKG